MESIEQLKLENEKLNARLNKAVEVFKEQKLQIETLTDELNRYKESSNESASIEELQKVIESKDQANKILQETYDNVFSDYTTLKEKIAEFKTTIQSFEELKENHIKEIQGLNEQINKSDKEIYNLDNLLNEKRTDYDELKQRYEVLHEVYQKTKNLHDDDLKRYNELENNYENLQNIHNKNLLEIEASHTNIAKLQKDCNDAVKTATAYQKSYEEVKDQNVVLQEKLDKMIEEVQALEKERSNHKRIISEMESLKTGSEEVINELTKELESKNIELSQYKNKQQKYEEFVTTIFGISDSFRNNGNNVEEIKPMVNPPMNKQNNSKPAIKANSTNNPFMTDAVGMNI